MDAYYRKTRRPNATLSGSLKRPPPISQSIAPTTNQSKVSTPDKIATHDTTASVSPAKTPSPPPRPRPTTPTNARIARPKQPPPVKRKLISNEQREVRKIARTTPRELFRSIHPLDKDKLELRNEEQQITSIESTHNHSTKTTPDDEVAASFGLKRLHLPATPPSTPVKQQVKRLPTPQSSPTCPASPSKIAAGPLKGVSSSLLDLIRAKEAKARETTPEQKRREELLGIAPEIARIVPTVFTANKKDFLLYDKVVEKCFKGLKSNYTSDTIADCLDLMKKVAPEWISVVDISKGRFMRYNKDRYTLPQILVAIQRFRTEKGVVR